MIGQVAATSTSLVCFTIVQFVTDVHDIGPQLGDPVCVILVHEPVLRHPDLMTLVIHRSTQFVCVMVTSAPARDGPDAESTRLKARSSKKPSQSGFAIHRLVPNQAALVPNVTLANLSAGPDT